MIPSASSLVKKDSEPHAPNITFMPNMKIDNHSLDWSLRYSPRRRTVQIRVIGADRLEVAAPTGMPLEKIQLLLNGKAAWISRQIGRLKAAAANPANASLTHGATLLYQGVPHCLLLLADGNRKPHVTLHNNSICIHLTELIGQDNDPTVYHTLKSWYGRQAQALLSERTLYWSGQIGVTPSRISLRDQKSRWGSCSSRKTISYNWRIIMAPPEVLDYLVVHELCHLIHPNHSPAYWREVSRWVPDYRGQRRWLRQNGSLLTKILTN